MEGIAGMLAMQMACRVKGGGGTYGHYNIPAADHIVHMSKEQSVAPRTTYLTLHHHRLINKLQTHSINTTF